MIEIIATALRRNAHHLIGHGRWWVRAHSAANWLEGYQYRPVQRHRCCEHTTPEHDARRPCYLANAR